MNVELIPAKPFIWQYDRLLGRRIEEYPETVTDTIKQKLHNYSNIYDWRKVLFRPFKPEEIPDVLEGWHGKRDARNKRGYELTFNNDEFDWFYFLENRDFFDYQYEDRQNRLPNKPATLNHFLSDLDRAGITAHFRADWIAKNKLK